MTTLHKVMVLLLCGCQGLVLKSTMDEGDINASITSNLTLRFDRLKGIKHAHCGGEEPLFKGFASGKNGCEQKCMLFPDCEFYSFWSGNKSADSAWCHLTTSCKSLKNVSSVAIDIYRKVNMENGTGEEGVEDEQVRKATLAAAKKLEKDREKAVEKAEKKDKAKKKKAAVEKAKKGDKVTSEKVEKKEKAKKGDKVTSEGEETDKADVEKKKKEEKGKAAKSMNDMGQGFKKFINKIAGLMETHKAKNKSKPKRSTIVENKEDQGE